MRCFALLVFAGCASATSGSERTTADAPRGHDADEQIDAPMHVDAAPHVDAAVTTVDAPASGCAFTGALATYTLTAETGSQTQSNASATATGVVAGALTRASGLTATSGAGSINSSGWPTSAARDLTKYYAFSVAPPAGCALDLTSVAIDTKSSGTGPATLSLATCADSFGATTPVTANVASTVTTSVTNQSGTLEIRIYGYGGTAASGTMRIQNTLTATGTLH